MQKIEGLPLFDFINQKDEPLLQVTPVIDYSMRGMCVRPYRGHKKGCPKFNDPRHSDTCPPGAPLFDKYFDLSFPVFAVVNVFNLEAHMAELATHSRKDGKAWTDEQLRCVLYWQKGKNGRIRLKNLVDRALLRKECRGYEGILCPEGFGVNVTETMKRAGVILEWPVSSIRIIRQVAFLAKPLTTTKGDIGDQSR